MCRGANSEIYGMVYMKVILTIVNSLLFLAASPLETGAQITVSGDVTGVWTSDNNPYTVTGSVNIVDSLIIEPGVIVKFDFHSGGSHSIFADENDKFVARGTEFDPVFFLPYVGGQAPGSWGSLHFSGSGNDDTLRHCVIRYGTNGVYCSNSNPTINNCEIYEHSSHGVYGYDSDIQIEDCVIHNNQYHGICLKNHHDRHGARIVGCDIYESKYSGIAFFGYDSIGSVSASCEIERCRVYDNPSNGVHVVSGTYWIGGTAHSLAKISNCTIVGNNAGVRAFAYRGYAEARVTNSIVAFNETYGVVNEDSESHIEARDVGYSCFWHNGIGNFFAIRSIPAGFGANGDFQNANGDSCDVNFNMYSDPSLTDLSTHDYSLQLESKCIDAGTSDVDGELVMDPDGTLPDIGALHYDQLSDAETANSILEVYVFPVPASARSDQLTFVVRSDGGSAVAGIRVYDGHYSKVAEFDHRLRGGSNQISYDISLLAPGVYLYEVEVHSDAGRTLSVDRSKFIVVP